LSAFDALALFVGRQEEHPACKQTGDERPGAGAGMRRAVTARYIQTKYCPHQLQGLTYDIFETVCKFVQEFEKVQVRILASPIDLSVGFEHCLLR